MARQVMATYFNQTTKNVVVVGWEFKGFREAIDFIPPSYGLNCTFELLNFRVVRL